MAEAANIKRDSAERELATFLQWRESLPKALTEADSVLDAAEARLRIMEAVRDKFLAIQATVEDAVKDAAGNAPLTDQVKSFQDRAMAELSDHQRHVEVARSAVDDARQGVLAAQMQLEFYRAAYQN